MTGARRKRAAVALPDVARPQLTLVEDLEAAGPLPPATEPSVRLVAPLAPPIAVHQRRAKTVSRHASAIARAAPIMAQAARRQGTHGVTVDECKPAWLAAGVITGGETGRALSWLAGVPRAARLVASGRRRYSENGNDLMVWLDPSVGRAAPIG